jgi:hypothetical protein
MDETDACLESCSGWRSINHCSSILQDGEQQAQMGAEGTCNLHDELPEFNDGTCGADTGLGSVTDAVLAT